jgi:uncharacterized small protein (DUF1192 family)
MSTAGKGSK